MLNFDGGCCEIEELKSQSSADGRWTSVWHQEKKGFQDLASRTARRVTALGQKRRKKATNGMERTALASEERRATAGKYGGVGGR